MMAKDRANRYRTPGEVAKEFTPFKKAGRRRSVATAARTGAEIAAEDSAAEKTSQLNDSARNRAP
jgi:hypothetical protein